MLGSVTKSWTKKCFSFCRVMFVNGHAELNGYLEGLFVDVCVISHIRLSGLAEENEVLKEENVTEAFLLPESYQELILAYQLTLFFQIDLCIHKRKCGYLK